MENSQTAASSSPSFVDSSIIGNGEDSTSLPTDVSHSEDSYEEAWFDDDCDNELELHNEWKLRRDKFYTDGYREGTIEGQKDAAQNGFNLGFKDSVMVGYKWGIIRGVTSAFAHMPDELKEKLVETVEVRKELMNLHVQVDSIATEDALKLFHEDIEKRKTADSSSSGNSAPSRTHQSDRGGLETYVRKLELLLKESSEINVRIEATERASS
ncbi:hypothetical protein RND81_08G104500 [Saponaria officinalis]|uniref:Essential protein Yae1 N-terminal domain-containing protein n=1 Tax=Saponaria officinalis TaxID=3572 RepID=A0AAW1J5V3_SAPOF